jgi:hypothetical protein
MKNIQLLLLVCLMSASLSAQEKQNETSIDVQLRSRGEYRNGALNPHAEDADPAFFINERARLVVGYKNDNLQIKLSGQNVGVWGQYPQIDKGGRFALNEAWARFNLGKGFFGQAGRQILAYDDDRILGSLDWNVAGRSHDALKLGWENTGNKLHLILAFNQNDEKITGGTYYAAGAQPYKTMQTFWYGFNRKENPFTFSALLMNLGLEGGNAAETESKVFYLQTLGANFGYALKDWKFAGSIYYQAGKTVADNSVSAFMGSVSAGWQATSRIGLKAGIDYLSGDNAENKEYQAFNPLYGTHHKFYGTMDYFYVSNFAPGLNPGLTDLYLGIALKASAKQTLSANYHYFRINSDIKNAENKNISKGLGSEIDLQYDVTLLKNVGLTLGYSVMFGSSSMDIVKGGDHNSWQDWGWISLNINPQILFHKW